MFNSDAEKQFEDYRYYLQYEASRLASYVALYRRLYERRVDRLEEMSIAPAFFSVTADAPFSAIILWTDKLFDEHAERGIFNFLKFVEHHRDIFTIEHLKRRRNYPDGHWMLDRDPIARQTINEHRKSIQNLDCLKSFKTRRDKFHAHFDKKYFFDRKRLADEAPLTWGDLEKVIEALADIINHYSADYDGQLFSLEPMNIKDLDYLLDRLHECKKPKGS
jgi:hypothetical protein